MEETKRSINVNDPKVLKAAKGLAIKAKVNAWDRDFIAKEKARSTIGREELGLFTRAHTEKKPEEKESFKTSLLSKLDADISKNALVARMFEEFVEQQDFIFRSQQKVIKEKANKLQSCEKCLEILQKQYQENERGHLCKLSELRAQCETASTATDSVIKHADELEDEIIELKKRRKALLANLERLNSVSIQLKDDEEVMTKNLATIRVDIEAVQGVCEDLSEKNAELETSITRCEDRDKAKYELRKDRHNYMQELKGNIRVYCRVRPRPASESAVKDIIMIPNDHTIEILPPILPTGVGVTSSKALKSERFILDKVFAPEATQENIFSEVSSFVKSVLDGYNVCIFAYGQTGTGKTYTMEGNLDDPNFFGIIPRSVGQIFESTHTLEKWGWEYQLEVSFQEIYNEKLIDLICRDNNISQNTSLHAYSPTQISVKSQEELFLLIKMAHENRTTAETKFNATSSRSHSVFQIKISGRNEGASQHVESVLSLIDLAGSESLSGSIKHKDREQETKSINKSLSALKDVITALAEHRDHIPSRNSKLTYLLKDYLGGNCKTLMFVNISSLLPNYMQTMQSLRFACKVNSCYINLSK